MHGYGRGRGKGKGKGKGGSALSVSALHWSPASCTDLKPENTLVPLSQPVVNSVNTLRTILEDDSEVHDSLDDADHELDISTESGKPLSYAEATVNGLRNPRKSDESFPKSKLRDDKLEQLLSEGRRTRDAQLKKKVDGSPAASPSKPSTPHQPAKESGVTSHVPVRKADRADFPYTEKSLAAKKNEWDQIQGKMLRKCQTEGKGAAQVCSFQTC